MRELALAVLMLAAGAVAAAGDERPPTMGEVLAASQASDWRPLDPDHTLYMDLPGGRVVIALAPELAPRHVANIETLVKQGYFDGLAVVRSQENYVVQWGDPAAEPEERRSLGEAARSLAPEWERPLDGATHLTCLPDPDPYAPRVGFVHGMPVGVDPEKRRIWQAHCYATVGVGRGVAADSGSGAELYVVIGHAPRHLDRNVTLVGRVVQGMEHLSTLPRGTGPLGFYESEEERVPIRSVRLGSQLPETERASLELLRTDTEAFERLIASRRTRSEEWFVDPTGRIGLCNVPLPVRERESGGSSEE
ncbi:MAG: peptidylprolyl isomerase [Thermoanaerobaculia bacterium]|nr:peptidylprolyl isomerase [Thermoanaerobaculia bacterium]